MRGCPWARGKHSTHGIRKRASERAQSPGRVARTSTVPAGSGPRILKIFLERGLSRDWREKSSPVQTSCLERNMQNYGELKSGSLIAVDLGLRPGKETENFHRAPLADRRD